VKVAVCDTVLVPPAFVAERVITRLYVPVVVYTRDGGDCSVDVPPSPKLHAHAVTAQPGGAVVVFV
jgi:hypothetical protein